jgi:hypothetical protein
MHDVSTEVKPPCVARACFPMFLSATSEALCRLHAQASQAARGQRRWRRLQVHPAARRSGPGRGVTVFAGTGAKQ